MATDASVHGGRWRHVHSQREIERRERLAARQDWKCPACELAITRADIAGGLTHADHVIPRSLGGPTIDWNMDLLHEGCNMIKSARITDRAVARAAANGFRIRPPAGRFEGRLRTAIEILERAEDALAEIRRCDMSATPEARELADRAVALASGIARLASFED
jgi:hypothetical protein